MGNSHSIDMQRSPNLGVALAWAATFKHLLTLLPGSPPMRRAL